MQKPRANYDLETVTDILARHGATIEGEYPRFIHFTRVMFICACGQRRNKLLREIIEVSAKCKECTQKDAVDKRRATNIRERGVACTLQDPSVAAKRKKTWDDKYGGHPMLSNSVKEKIVTNNLEKYGKKWTGEVPEVKEKIRQTFQEKYGGPPSQHPEVREKQKQTLLKKYGVEQPMHSAAIRQKLKDTNMRVRGVENPSQDPTVQEKKSKTSFRRKNYTLPSGRTIRVQGDEDKAMDILLQKYEENDIVVGDIHKIPRIEYAFGNNQCYYFPDAYIPKDNLIIEVKSEYTLGRNAEIFTKNLAKFAATIKLGYTFKMIVFDKRGKEVNANEAIEKLKIKYEISI